MTITTVILMEWASTAFVVLVFAGAIALFTVAIIGIIKCMK
ncbi:hypothetical protein LCGC14_1969530 [marine sediment metagenome]|uniref:Uncharacterized protein n=1 Tax=marine sediment metagenome TaxID=412755 RepID=A0A0F9FC69_9ZZZZ